MAKTAKQEKSYDLVIVESPAKAKTIGQFLGEGYLVRSSYGHIRDLKKNNFGVDIEHNYEPEYIIPIEKSAIVDDLRALANAAQSVWLASDEDREGEAISWHLAEVLGLDSKTTKRIVFHEITRTAILNAIKTPRTINQHLVDAQQARRILDRLVGFELSPVLWRKVKPQLSAGRVQSVAVRILVEREREIFAFKPQSSFQVVGVFTLGDGTQLRAELSKRLETKEQAQEFLYSCIGRKFKITSVETKPATRCPAPPFTTSTLQQEASRKLGYSVSQTMSVAQRLYELGLITYMRTDSVNLADTALAAAAEEIKSTMGENYLKIRKYKTKSKGAQEAHEAIRPTNLSKPSIEGAPFEQRLYDLIWKRTIASQMADAKIERTTIQISAGDDTEMHFTAVGEVVLFDGFMKVYAESSDDESSEIATAKLPHVTVGEQLEYKDIASRERWTQRPARYNEAMLVRKLEELGIGRPSTYAPTISTIQQRGYVTKESRDGQVRRYDVLRVKGDKVTEEEHEEFFGAEKNKLFPTDIGMVVNDFLMDHFQNVMSYDFTANVEEQFDDIAEGKLQWQTVIDQFYKPFHVQIEKTMEISHKNNGERVLGIDKASGKQVMVRIGRFGPMAQIGDANDDGEKPRFSALRHGQHIETITLEEALALFELPRNLGQYEGKDVVIGIGRFGPFIRHDNKFVSLKKGVDDPYTIDFETAIIRIEQKREDDRNKVIKTFPEDANIQILNGRWGPYIANDKKNIRIPKNKDAAKLTYEECLEMIEAQASKDAKAKRSASVVNMAKAAAKKATTTKVSPKKSAGKKTKAK